MIVTEWTEPNGVLEQPILTFEFAALTSTWYSFWGHKSGAENRFIVVSM